MAAVEWINTDRRLGNNYRLYQKIRDAQASWNEIKKVIMLQKNSWKKKLKNLKSFLRHRQVWRQTACMARPAVASYGTGRAGFEPHPSRRLDDRRRRPEKLGRCWGRWSRSSELAARAEKFEAVLKNSAEGAVKPQNKYSAGLHHC